jgi:hypothetical protein
MHLALWFLWMPLLLGAASSALWAQTTYGGVAGTVKDPTGAVIRGAQVKLINQATQVVQTTQSTSTGTYVFSAVPVGTYTLSADAPGFRTYVDTGLQVHIQNIATVDIPLALGDVNQQVTVTSAVPLLQAQDATLGQTVPSVQVNDLPLNGRNWLSLANLASGTYMASNPSNASSMYVNGVSSNQVDYTLNGVDNNEEVFFGVNITPVPDAIQEFKLQDGNNSAQFGQFSGAIINAAIKSGTNHFHGDAWEYLRNEALNANDYFNKQNGTPRQKYRQNQFGGTVGGPVRIPWLYNGKDKTFFFFDYQHTGITQQAAFTDTVPTSNMQSSDFQNLQDLINDNSGSNTDALGRTFSHGTVLDPATTRPVAAGAVDPVSGFSNTTSSTIYVRDPFYSGGSIAGIKNFTTLTSQLNVIPAGRLDPNGVKLLQLLPPPTKSGLSNNYYVTPPAPQDVNQYDVRIDENISQKNLVWGVFSRSMTNIASYQPFPGIAGGENSISPVTVYPRYELALGYTYVFSPKMENEMTGGYDHDSESLTMPNANTLGIPAEFGIQGIPQNPGNGGLTPMEPSGISSFGTRKSMPTIQTTTALQFQDNLMKIHGAHEFNIGFDFNHIRGNILQPQRSKGLFGFTGLFSDIPNKNSSLIGIADMLIAPGTTTVPNGISNLGGPSSYVGSDYVPTDYFADYYAAYVQDNWRPTSKLTFNLGLRWEYFSPYGENNGREANFIAAGDDGFTSPTSTSVSGTYYMPNQGCSVARSASFNSVLAGYNINIDCTSGLTANKAQKGNFGPRVGFAYRIFPRLVVRGAYGIAYGAFDSVSYGGTLGTNYPFLYEINSPTVTSQTPDLLPNGQTATIENTFAQINMANPALVTGTGLSLYGKQYNYQTPFTQSANLTIQDQFTKRDSIQVGYVASIGRNLDVESVQNSPSLNNARSSMQRKPDVLETC